MVIKHDGCTAIVPLHVPPTFSLNICCLSFVQSSFHSLFFFVSGSPSYSFSLITLYLHFLNPLSTSTLPLGSFYQVQTTFPPHLLFNSGRLFSLHMPTICKIKALFKINFFFYLLWHFLSLNFILSSSFRPEHIVFCLE